MVELNKPITDRLAEGPTLALPDAKGIGTGQPDAGR